MNILKTFKFRGGVHPLDKKELCAKSPLRELPLPAQLAVSTSQHIGAPATPAVKPGDRVVANQLIASATGAVSANIYSPACGTVAEIKPMPSVTGRMAPAIVIDVDPADTSSEKPFEPIADWNAAAPAELLERIRLAGIVGMGGAGFPTAVKLAPPKPIDHLIVNGAECEPYLNADNRLMIEHADEVAAGMMIISRILGGPATTLTIEDNKPEAIAAMKKALEPCNVNLAILRTKYPHGSEKHQIFAVTGRQVPPGKLPMDVGCVVDNVATAKAVYDAVAKGLPLTRRAVTVTGEGVAEPANFIAPVGTPYSALIAAAGGTKGSISKIVSGGPMMGFAVPDDTITTTKTTSGITVLTDDETDIYLSNPCINCGRCLEACPLGLMPAEAARAVEADDIELAEKLNVMDCFECGSCTFACPARRPLVQHFRRAKAIIAANRRKTQAKAQK